MKFLFLLLFLSSSAFADCYVSKSNQYERVCVSGASGRFEYEGLGTLSLFSFHKVRGGIQFIELDRMTLEPNGCTGNLWIVGNSLHIKNLNGNCKIQPGVYKLPGAGRG